MAKDHLQESINNYVEWTQNWRIRINPSKSNCKIFTLRRPKNPPEVAIQGTIIPWSTSPIKYLGVLLDKRLTWKPQVNAVIDKTKCKIFNLSSIINRRTPLRLECSLLVFKQVILPTMTYACPIWGGAASSTIDRLSRLQNKYLRTTLNAPWFIPNHQIRRELDIPDFKETVNKLASNFFNNLPNAPCSAIFNLGRNYNSPRILSRFPKDKFKPP